MPYVFLALVLFWCQISSAQLNGKYIFRHITQEDGLLHSFVLDIRQDEKGYMWIQTLNGLQRYDGHRFVNYPQVIIYPHEADARFSKLMIDTLNQKVNVVILGFMQSLDLHRNTISLIQMEKLTENSIPKPVVIKTKDNSKYVILDKGQSLYQNDSLMGSYIFSDRERNTWLARDSVSGEIFIPQSLDFGVLKNGAQKIEFMSDEHPTHPLLVQLQEVQDDLIRMNKPYLKGVFIQHIAMDSYRNLWILPWNEYLLRYDLNTQKLHYYDLQKLKESKISDQSGDPVIQLTQIFEDRQRQLWIAMNSAGIALYDRTNDDFEFITSDSRISNGLEFSFEVSTIYQDRDDNIWVGTDRGISIFNPYRNQIQAIRHQDGNPRSPPKNDIMDVIETAEGEILSCSWGGGISVFDKEWNFQRQVVFEGGDYLNQVWCFVQNDDGNIWAGAQAGYLHIYDPMRRTFKTIRPPETGFNTITLMKKDLHGNIIMGLGNHKIVLWKKSENKFYPYNDAGDSNYINTNALYDIFIDNQNMCWVSCDFGLKVYNQEKRIFTGNYFLPSEGRKGTIVHGIESYNDTFLLVGAERSGLQLFNKPSRKFEPFFKDELPEYTSVNAVKKDVEGNIWFTSQFHLFKINTQHEVTRVHLRNDIVHNAMGTAWFYELSDGRWVSSSYSEMICFNPIQFDTDSIEFSVRISGFKLFDQDIYIDSFLSQQKPVVLRHDQNFFSIEFCNMHFLDARTIHYYYRLSDVDPNWVRTELPVAEYTDIKPGDYVFEVKAKQGSGFSRMVSCHVIIKPPWWESIWFRALFMIALVAFIMFLIRKRIQVIRKEGELKHRIAETEMMALRSQMNPHFIFNCINGIDAMIQSNDKYRATIYLNKFAKLIRNVLESSASSKIPLSKDIETLRLYIDLELFRHPGKFDVDIKVDEMLLQGDYKVPPLIIQPYVENAILHGLRNRPDTDGILKIAVLKTNEHLHFCIEDNGVGRIAGNGDGTKLTGGLGMRLGSDRIRLFNDEDIASVNITDLFHEGISTGTRVDIKLKAS